MTSTMQATGRPQTAGGRRALLCAAAVAALAATMLSPQIASAADATADATDAASPATLPTLMVTARRTEEDVQKVPLTVTALTPTVLQQQHITDVQDLTFVAPSLTVATNKFTNLDAQFAVRGLTTGVTTYFSDAPCCDSFASIPFMDIGQVQVLNGPQGTLFGRSSAAGAVLIDPQHPNMSAYEGLLDVTGGDYGRVQATGVINVPLMADHLALRIAVNANHVDGYTQLLPAGEKLDETNDQQYRIGLEFKNGGFDDYLVGDYLNVDETPTSNVLVGANPASSLLNLPSFYGPFVFGAVCAQAVSFGLSPDANTCVTQRMATLATVKADLIAESARVAGGGNAIRSTPAPYNSLPLVQKDQHADLIDVAQYDFGAALPFDLSLKNVASIHTDRSVVSDTLDGIGGILENGVFGSGPTLGLSGNFNEIGNEENPQLGPAVIDYTEEFQVHARDHSGLVVSTFGVFYSDEVTPKNLSGTAVNYQVYGGTLTPNLGYLSSGGFQFGQNTTSTAVYGQATLDLSKVGVHGLSLTGGYRYSWDYSRVQTLPEVANYPSGVFTPGAPLSTVISRSQGYNYTFSVAEQATDHLLLYGAVSRAYVPGGVNSVSAVAASLPAYTPTYGSEVVLDREIGAKYDFSLGTVYGRINVDAYWDDFTNIIESFTGVVGATSVVYSENIAAAELNGIEVQGDLVPIEPLQLTLGYNYNNAHYTNWIGEDPFNVATPGQAICLPSSPAGACYLNLKNNPFPYMPAQQVHLTVRYKLPVDAALGKVSLIATGYAQSRIYYEPDAARDLQVLPQSIDDFSQAPYALLNLRLDWQDIRGSGWNAAVFADNVTDTVYATGKLPQMVTLGFASANYGPPRMVGIEISRKFGG